jgi:hypothetical protein
MMMKFTALGVVHDETERAAKESGEASLSQTKRRRNEEKKNNTQRQPRKRRESSVYCRQQADFAHASEGSDAESKSEMKWCGVPHSENQPKYTSELISRALVEHESREMLL